MDESCYRVDYLGVIHINIMCDTTFEDVLVNSLQRLENQEVSMFLAVDTRLFS